jgi:hypothetical protein
MDDNSFQITTRNAFYRCIFVLNKKKLEYSPGEDRLESFKNASELQGESPEKCLWGMLTKHLTSLSGMCKLVGSCATPYSQEVWEEKITDAHNYLFLLEGLLKERYNWNSPEIKED